MEITSTSSVRRTSPAPAQKKFPFSVIPAVAIILAIIFVFRMPALDKPWSQDYNPMGWWWLSTIIAAMPVFMLLGSLAIFREAHVRLVKGNFSSTARFSMTEFAIPGYPKMVASLYELQRLTQKAGEAS